MLYIAASFTHTHIRGSSILLKDTSITWEVRIEPATLLLLDSQLSLLPVINTSLKVFSAHELFPIMYYDKQIVPQISLKDIKEDADIHICNMSAKAGGSI